LDDKYQNNCIDLK